MEFRFYLLCSIIGLAAAQTNYYKLCIPSSQQSLCQRLEKDDSRIGCETVESRVHCALKLARGEADIGFFSEEELLLLGQQQPNDHRVVASVRNVKKNASYAFEAVAIVPSSHINGLEGLKGGNYCHPGFDQKDQRWSPRVLKALERSAARSDRCNEGENVGTTAEEIEVLRLSEFFKAGCRPGPWSSNDSIDAKLKSKYPSLCSLCGEDPSSSSCSGYSLDMGVSVSGASNDNRHIQSLQCLVKNGPGTVAFVAWQHVQEYFTMRASHLATSYSALCQDGSLRPLTMETLASPSSPCAFVQQPWHAVVATSSRASAILRDLQTWWPNGVDPSGNTWQSILYQVLVGGSELRPVFETDLPTPRNYTSARNLPDLDTTTSCFPPLRWCTRSSLETTKCSWLRRAAYTLGIEPAISCQQRNTALECLKDIKDNRADFISADSHYGYLARQHYKLSPVKLLQNSRNNANSMVRIAALVRESSSRTDITRFENLRGKKACFPEFGGIAYVSFVRTARDIGVVSASQCDYARAAGDLFSGACAPGAVDAGHALGNTDYNMSTLCDTCRSNSTTPSFTCSYDSTNLYFGNKGTLACLSDPNNDVAFLDMQNIQEHLNALGLNAENFRVLCRNNTLAASSGVNVDDNCLLAMVVDAEVLTRKNDNIFNSLSSVLDAFEEIFGYNAAVANQLINLEIYSPFDGTSNLLFKDSAIGLTEPSSESTHEPARNYFELFKHLETCNRGISALASSSSFYPIMSLAILTLIATWLM